MLFLMKLATMLLHTSLLISAVSLFTGSRMHPSEWQRREKANSIAELGWLAALFFAGILAIMALVHQFFG